MGFLERTISRIRKFVDEPATNAKYTDADLLDLIEVEWASILAELNRTGQRPLVVRHDLSVPQGAEILQLPPIVQNLLQIVKLTRTGDVEWAVTPASRYNPAGPGVLFEGPVIRFQPPWSGGTETLRLEFVPSGDIRLHGGTAGTITNSLSANTCTVVLASSPSVGSLDTRPNAYAGSILRILSASTNNYMQERIIQSYNVTSRTATLAPAFEAALLPGGATVTYEIAPLLYQAHDFVVAMAVARNIAVIEGDPARTKFLTQRYAERMRDLRLNESAYQGLVGDRMSVDTRYNRRYLEW